MTATKDNAKLMVGELIVAKILALPRLPTKTQKGWPFREHIIQTLSDEKLMQEGKKLRSLVSPKPVGRSSVFDWQLELFREGHRRRHPKQFCRHI